MFDTASAKVAEKLCGVFIIQGANRLQFYELHIVHKQICEVVAQFSTIGIEDNKRMLLYDLAPLLPQSLSQSIFIYFFRVTMPQNIDGD